MADATRDMRRSVNGRDLMARVGCWKLAAILHQDLRSQFDAIVGSMMVAMPARELVSQVIGWAIERGQEVETPRRPCGTEIILDSRGANARARFNAIYFNLE
jgi:hypothetical protein